MQRVLSALIAAALLSSPACVAATEDEGGDSMSALRQEVSELKAAVLELTRRLEALERRLPVTQRFLRQPSGRLLFPIEVERAMILEGLVPREMPRGWPPIVRPRSGATRPVPPSVDDLPPRPQLKPVEPQR
jgi:hypothetical protein